MACAHGAICFETDIQFPGTGVTRSYRSPEMFGGGLLSPFGSSRAPPGTGSVFFILPSRETGGAPNPPDGPPARPVMKNR